MPVAYVDSGQNTSQDNTNTAKMLLDRMTGIEGVPYQFMKSVDERIRKSSSSVTSSETMIGRKYGEKIVGRMPLLFLTPCEPYFLNSDKNDQNVLFGALLSNQIDSSGVDLTDLISDKSKGVRYYSAQYATADYYKYLNLMLNTIANYLGLGDETITLGSSSTPVKLGQVAWQDELSPNFSSYFYTKTFGENSLFFYCDSMDSVSESFTNDTTQSSLASQINGYSDSIKEMQFLLGGSDSGLATSTLDDIQKALSDTSDKGLLAGFASGIVELLTNAVAGKQSWLGNMQNSFGAIAAGGKIIFPEIWSDSQYSKSYSLDIKLRSPDHDSLSIFLNIIKPYCKLLALTMPRAFRDIGSHDVDPNGYGSPFLVKASCKGLFNIDMGMITGLSVTKGASCAWNDDGLPTQIDITLDIKDLYNTLAMSGYPDLKINVFDTFGDLLDVTKNEAYLDFLANIAGLNVAEMMPYKKLRTDYYNLKSMINQIPSTIGARFDQSIANFIGKASWFR